MSILITGGAGFVASHLIEKILKTDRGMGILLVDNLVRTNSLRNVEHLIDNSQVSFLNTDISTLDFSKIDSMYESIQFIFHLSATRINRCNEFNLEGHNSIADGGFKLIDWASHNKDLLKFFFASSASVYKSPDKLPILESDHTDPYTIYGAGKLYTENILKCYNLLYGLNYSINRFFSVYGPRMDNAGPYTEVIFNWLNKIKHKDYKINCFGNPDEKVLDLVYVTDVVEAIYLSITQDAYGVYNVSTGTGVTLTELIKVMENVTGKKFKINVLPENRKDIEKKRIGDITRLTELGWKPKVSLEEGINNVWEWMNEK